MAAWTAWFTSSSRSNVVWSFVVIYYSLDVVHALPVVYIDSRAQAEPGLGSAGDGVRPSLPSSSGLGHNRRLC